MGASLKPGYKDLSKSPWDVPLNSGSKGFRKGDGLLVHRVARMFEQLLLLLLLLSSFIYRDNFFNLNEQIRVFTRELARIRAKSREHNLQKVIE